MHMDMSQKAFRPVIYKENGGPVSRDACFVRPCAVEMHMDMSQEAFCVVIYKENAGPVSRDTRFVRACAVEMHMDMSQEAFCAVIYRENAGPVSRDSRFVRACAVEMHMDMSQEAFCAEIYRENAGRFQYHLDWTPGLNCYRKNPSVWPHCLGNSTPLSASKWTIGGIPQFFSHTPIYPINIH